MLGGHATSSHSNYGTWPLSPHAACNNAQWRNCLLSLLRASSNNVIIMFDFEPFNSVITTHYFSVLFDLQSPKPENSVFSMPRFELLIVSCVQIDVCVCVCILLVIEMEADTV